MGKIMTHAEIEVYLNQFFDAFIFKDIENCIAAKANYVVALALLTYTEYLGGLKTGNLGLSDKTPENFRAGLELFEWNGDPNYYKGFAIEIEDQGVRRQCDVYTLFRCGMVHEYLIKGESLVHNNPRVDYCIPADQGIGWHDHERHRILRFHTNAYFRDFKNAVQKYKGMLRMTQTRELFSSAIERLNERKVL